MASEVEGPRAMIVGRGFGHGVFWFRWVGPADGVVPVSHTLERAHFLGLLPWRLVKVADDPGGVAWYRRAG